MSDSLHPVDCSTTGFPILHYPLEFAQVHVHWVGDAIQPSYPLPRILLEKILTEAPKEKWLIIPYLVNTSDIRNNNDKTKTH